jgi:membrane-associated phospholipid phosphatase
VVVPTLGPMAALAKDTAFVNVPSIGRGTADIMIDLREGTVRTISLSSLAGIISFPSLHAAASAIVPFACRWNRAVFYPILVLDAVMFISTVPSGNHYLTDAVGGLAIALLAIAFGYYVENWLNQLVAFFFKFPQRERPRIDVDLRQMSSVVPE